MLRPESRRATFSESTRLKGLHQTFMHYDNVVSETKRFPRAATALTNVRMRDYSAQAELTRLRASQARYRPPEKDIIVRPYSEHDKKFWDSRSMRAFYDSHDHFRPNTAPMTSTLGRMTLSSGYVMDIHEANKNPFVPKYKPQRLDRIINDANDMRMRRVLDDSEWRRMQHESHWMDRENVLKAEKLHSQQMLRRSEWEKEQLMKTQPYRSRPITEENRFPTIPPHTLRDKQYAQRVIRAGTDRLNTRAMSQHFLSSNPQNYYGQES